MIDRNPLGADFGLLTGDGPSRALFRQRPQRTARTPDLRTTVTWVSFSACRGVSPTKRATRTADEQVGFHVSSPPTPNKILPELPPSWRTMWRGRSLAITRCRGRSMADMTCENSGAPKKHAWRAGAGIEGPDRARREFNRLYALRPMVFKPSARAARASDGLVMGGGVGSRTRARRRRSLRVRPGMVDSGRRSGAPTRRARPV